MVKYKFFTINEPGKLTTIQSFNTITAARVHAKRNAKKHLADYAIYGHTSVSAKSDYLEHHKYDVFKGLTSHKMRTSTGKLVK